MPKRTKTTSSWGPCPPSSENTTRREPITWKKWVGGSAFASDLISVFGPDHILGEIEAEMTETSSHIGIAKQRLVKSGLLDNQSLQDMVNLNSYLANLRLLHSKLEPIVKAYRRQEGGGMARVHQNGP